MEELTEWNFEQIHTTFIAHFNWALYFFFF